MKSVLDIYVAAHCFGTAEALRLAAEVKSQLPDVKVNVTDLSENSDGGNPHIPATPSYVLDGKLIFLGNPGLGELVARIVSHRTNGGENIARA